MMKYQNWEQQPALGTQSSRLLVHGFVLEAKQSGRLRTQDPVATALGSETIMNQAR